jgi:hypothetical protein
MSANSKEKPSSLPEDLGNTRSMRATEAARAYHIGDVKDALPAIRAEAIFNKDINLMRIILNPPKSVPCFSASCFGPHELKAA